jgi:RimJ/RimL family protein N-acetyltransferase
VTIRRAVADDVEFIVELVSDADVEPFLGAVTANARNAVAAEIERSLAEPHDFGRFVIEADGERAGAMGFELANRRSRIAHLERLAVHPSFRGRGIADAAARQLQQHLFRDLGYHRLQLEIYGFNERAQRHAERSGFVREGISRSAYWRHGGWTDGVMYGLLADETGVPRGIQLLHDYVGLHNECARTGEWEALAEELPRFDDVVVTFRVREENAVVVADYGFLQEPARVAGQLLLTPAGDRIARLTRRDVPAAEHGTQF